MIFTEHHKDVKAKGECIVSGEDLVCKDLIIEGDFILVGNLLCRDIDIKGNCTIYGNIYYCRKVNVQGDLCVIADPIELLGKLNGGFFAPYGDIEVGGNLVCDSHIRAGCQKIKVGADCITRHVECESISVAGDCMVYPCGIDSEKAVYVLGDLTTGFAIEAPKVFCGGKYTREFYAEEEIAKIYEGCKHWHKVKKSNVSD